MKKILILAICMVACCGRVFAVVQTYVLGSGNDIPASATLLIAAGPLPGYSRDSRIDDLLEKGLVEASREQGYYYAYALGKMSEADKEQVIRNLENAYFVDAQYGVLNNVGQPDSYAVTITVFKLADVLENKKDAKEIYEMFVVAPDHKDLTWYDTISYMVVAALQYLYHPTDGINVVPVFGEDDFGG